MSYQPGANSPLSRVTTGGRLVELGPFTVDLLNARVYNDGCELRLRPQVFQVLRFLIQNPGRLIDYEEMLQGAWAGARVSRHTVAVTLGELKSELGECGYWVTVRQGHGYTLAIPESEHYMRFGRHFRNQFTGAGLENATQYFERATRIEGANSRAWEALAGAWLDMGFLSIRAPRDVRKSFLQAYQRALALRGLTPGLQLSRALSLVLFERKLAESESELLRVRGAGSNLTEVYVHLASVYYMRGRAEEALEEIRQAEKADVLSPLLAFAKPRLLLFHRDVEAAIASAKRAVDLYPNSFLTHLNYADALDFGGDTAEALDQYRIAGTVAPDVPWIRAAEARCLARQGRTREALRILADLKRNRKTEYVDACRLAFLLEALGRRDEAFEELERACAENSSMLCWLDLDTQSDTLRNDSRFVALRDHVFSSSGSS
jgi:tetratricopeptide (TPR) repeat protein